MDLSTAITSVSSSIDSYRAVSSWIPNKDSTDDLLKTALSNTGLTFAGLGAICANRGPRMGYLQNPVEPLTGKLEDTTGMQFSTGTTGWWFNYAMDDAGKTGWLIIIFRYPTKTNEATAETALYNIGGYVVSDGVRYPFSTDGNPLTCTGDYQILKENSDNTCYTLATTATDFDDSALVSSLIFSVDTTGLVVLSAVFISGESFSGNALTAYSAVPHGDLQGCAPCTSGVGTNYWSWTYMNGSHNFTDSSGNQKSTDITAWFDHQWGSLGIAPRNGFSQILAATAGWLSAPQTPRWFWVTIALSKKVQYSCSVTIDSSATIEAGAKFHSKSGGIRYSYDSSGNPSVIFGLPVTVKVNSVLDSDSVLSDNVTVTVDSTEYTLTGMVSEGFVTLAGGSINQEVPCVVYSDKKVVGKGFLEMNHMHPAANNAADALRVMGQEISPDNLDALMPQKYSFSQVWPSLLVILSLILLCLGVIGLTVWGIIKLV